MVVTVPGGFCPFQFNERVDRVKGGYAETLFNKFRGSETFVSDVMK